MNRSMNKNLTLSSYVKRRNGVPLGAAGALGNMFKRSLGAASFDKFWQYWNPVWGYYLGRYVFYPLSLRLPQALALLLTFTVSGMLHDLAVILLKWQFVCFFTPWFTLMGIVVVVSKKSKLVYPGEHWLCHCFANAGLIIGSFVLTAAYT